MICNVTLVSPTEEQLRVFDASEVFEVTVVHSLRDLNNVKVPDCLVLCSDLNKSINDLSHVEHIISDIQYLFAICDSIGRDMSHTYLERSGFTIVFNTSGYKQLVHNIATLVFAKQESDRVFTFYGADRKVGLTSVCQDIAYMIANNTDLTVMYVDLSGHINYSFFSPKEAKYSNTSASIQDITAKLRSKVLTTSELLDVTTRVSDNLYVLQGIKNLSIVRHFGDTEVKLLLDICKSVADIVIVDAGSPSDCVMSLAALTYTRNRFLVTNDSKSALNNFNTFRLNILSELKLDMFNLVLTMLNDTSSSYASEVSSFYGVGKLACILPYNNDHTTSEMNQKPLCSYSKNSKYSSNITDLSNFILQYMGSSTNIKSSSLIGKLKTAFGKKVS